MQQNGSHSGPALPQMHKLFALAQAHSSLDSHLSIANASVFVAPALQMIYFLYYSPMSINYGYYYSHPQGQR